MWNCNNSFSNPECKYALGDISRLYSPSFNDVTGHVPVCVTCPVGQYEPRNLQADPNWCKMVTNIKSYYGNTTGTQVDPSSAYYKDLVSVSTSAKSYIQTLASNGTLNHLRSQGVTPLISSDMDDTIWNTFAESLSEGFCFNSESFDEYSFDRKFAPVTPALDVLHFARNLGVVPVFITGRAAIQEQNFLTQRQLTGPGFNLRGGVDYWGGPAGWAGKKGHDLGNGKIVQSINGVFFHLGKNTRTGKGTTASEYKNVTRKLIEDHGLPGIGKVKFICSQGDQWSDSGVAGGKRIKYPNATYFLP